MILYFNNKELSELLATALGQTHFRWPPNVTSISIRHNAFRVEVDEDQEANAQLPETKPEETVA